MGGDRFEISGSLNSTAGTLFGLDFYSNTSCDPSTHGEGQAWLGSDLRATDATGALDFTLNVLEGDDTTSPQAPVGNYITATATSYPGEGSGSTSEFSTCIEAGALPLLDLGTDIVTVTEGETATYTVALTAPPASDVTVSLASEDDDQATVSPPSMTFTSTAWNMAQTATVRGTEDLNLFDEVLEFTDDLPIAAAGEHGDALGIPASSREKASGMAIDWRRFSTQLVLEAVQLKVAASREEVTLKGILPQEPPKPWQTYPRFSSIEQTSASNLP